jgi:four helix bundle protein
MQDFKNLEAWKKSHAVTLETYSKTANFLRSELFGVTSQMRRAAVSISANIAEGSSRGGDKEFAQFLRVASASASELEYFSILVADLAYLKRSEAVALGANVIEVRRMLSGLMATLDA